MANCRSCETALKDVFVDLGVSPLANSYVRQEDLGKMERFYPLLAYVCHDCRLVQLDEFESPEHIFSDYAYFSSFSESWLKHAKQYVDNVVKRFALNEQNFVVEIASNDGYLLKNFLPYKIPLLGIEPAKNVAKVANDAGVRTQSDFFGQKLAEKIKAKFQPADLMIANNVLAHVPKLNDFVSGFKTLLAPEGVITFEFPHLMQLIKDGLFDTIYHEHFSYLSLHSASYALSRHGLKVFDVEHLSTHGGSLRLFVCHSNSKKHNVSANVTQLESEEKKFGLTDISAYKGFAQTTQKIKRDLLKFLIDARENGKRVAAYGAPAKGNTLLNYAGIRTDFVEFTVDRNPAKVGTYLPGTRIPVLSPEALFSRKPDYIFILPWNLKEEIMEQCKEARSWGAKFVVSHPSLKVF